MALRTLGLVFAENERLKLVMAFLADVLENRHVRLRKVKSLRKLQ